jgi:hypothetical protein
MSNLEKTEKVENKEKTTESKSLSTMDIGKVADAGKLFEQAKGGGASDAKADNKPAAQVEKSAKSFIGDEPTIKVDENGKVSVEMPKGQTSGTDRIPSDGFPIPKVTVGPDGNVTIETEGTTYKDMKRVLDDGKINIKDVPVEVMSGKSQDAQNTFDYESIKPVGRGRVQPPSAGHPGTGTGSRHPGEGGGRHEPPHQPPKPPHNPPGGGEHPGKTENTSGSQDKRHQMMEHLENKGKEAKAKIQAVLNPPKTGMPGPEAPTGNSEPHADGQHQRLRDKLSAILHRSGESTPTVESRGKEQEKVVPNEKDGSQVTKDGQGRVKDIASPNGEKKHVEYDGDKVKCITVTEPNGSSVKYERIAGTDDYKITKKLQSGKEDTIGHAKNVKVDDTGNVRYSKCDEKGAVTGTGLWRSDGARIERNNDKQVTDVRDANGAHYHVEYMPDHTPAEVRSMQITSPDGDTWTINRGDQVSTGTGPAMPSSYEVFHNGKRIEQPTPFTISWGPIGYTPTMYETYVAVQVDQQTGDVRCMDNRGNWIAHHTDGGKDAGGPDTPGGRHIPNARNRQV